MLSKATRRLLVPLYTAHTVTSNAVSRRYLSDTAESYEDNKPVVDRFAGVGQAFDKDVSSTLGQKIPESMVTIQKNGTVEMPISFYRDVLNSAFGRGGWALVPTGDIVELDLNSPTQSNKFVQLIREYSLYCNGRFISQCYGETNFYPGRQSYSDSTETIKSIALTRCCKDLGIASELWDKDWVSAWQRKHAHQEMVENITTNKRVMLWKKKADSWSWPFEPRK